MAATTKVWVNNSAPTCEDDDLNGFKDENNNLILGSGQALNTGDPEQTHKAVAQYSADGNFLVDSGAADTYVLSAIGAREAISSYSDGTRVSFNVGNTNTGASTVNVNSIGVKDIVDRSGAVLSAGDLNAGTVVDLIFDSANDRFFIYSTPSVFSNTFTSSEFTISSAGTFSQAHNFGVEPSLYQCQLICKNGQQGYSVGDTVIINPAGNDPGSGGTTIDCGMMIIVDPVNIRGFFGAAPNPMRIFNKRTGVSFNASNANWRLIVKAWR